MKNGGARPGAGRKPGGKNAKTEAWEQLGDYFTNAGAQRAMEIMSKAKDDKFMQFYTNLVELFKPKLARTEIKGTGKDEEVVIRVINE